MLTNPHRQVRETIFLMFQQGMDPGLYIQFQGFEKAQDPDPNKPFSAIFLSVFEGSQYSLAGATGKRHYNKEGTIVIQNFGPLSDNGFLVSELLAQKAEQCFRGKTGTGGIWFRDTWSTPIGPTSAWYQHNTTVSFEYPQYQG